LLGQQLNVVMRKLPKRLGLTNSKRLLLVWLYRLFRSILSAIRIVRPETVIRRRRRGFRAYWRWKSRPGVDRSPIYGEIRELIRQMSTPRRNTSPIRSDLILVNDKGIAPHSCPFSPSSRWLRLGLARKQYSWMEKIAVVDCKMLWHAIRLKGSSICSSRPSEPGRRCVLRGNPGVLNPLVCELAVGAQA
jgi:hypothetical protein